MSEQILITIIAAIPPTVAAGAALFVALRAKRDVNDARGDIREVHLSLNSRFDQWIEMVKIASHAEGVKDEHERAKSLAKTTKNQ